MKKNVLICDTQPVAVEGIKWLLENSDDLSFGGSVQTTEAIYALLAPVALARADSARESEGENNSLIPWSIYSDTVQIAEVDAFTPRPLPPLPAPLFDAIVVDKGLGLLSVISLLEKLAAAACPVPVVVWGSAITEGEALRLLQLGVRGILRRTSESCKLLTCLRAVLSGGTWMEDGIFGEAGKYFRPLQPQLTARERQIAELVERGLRNRDIAGMLGIQPGTVKIHVKHIFEKTGVRRRFGLALTGLQKRNSFNSLPSPPQFTV